MIVANFLTGVYLAVGLYLVLKARRRVKAAIAVLGIFFLGGVFLLCSDRNALLGIVNGNKIFAMFKNYDSQIRETRQKECFGRKK